MRRAASIAGAALMLAGTGCVQQDKYDNTVLSQFYWRSWVLHDVPVLWGPEEPLPGF